MNDLGLIHVVGAMTKEDKKNYISKFLSEKDNAHYNIYIFVQLAVMVMAVFIHQMFVLCIPLILLHLSWTSTKRRDALAGDTRIFQMIINISCVFPLEPTFSCTAAFGVCLNIFWIQGTGSIILMI